MNALLDCEKNIKSLKEFKAELLLREKNYRTVSFIQHSSFTDCTPTYFHHSCFPFSLFLLQTLSITSLIRFVICFWFLFPKSQILPSFTLHVTLQEYLMLPFLKISTVPLSDSRKKRHKETKRHCVTLEIVRLIQGHTKTFRAGKLTSITIATPSGNLWPNPQWIWLLISHTVTVSRGVGGEVHVRG